MPCNNATTVYWAGISFETSPQIYSDIGLTTVAPDGWYSVGGVYREMSGGSLGPSQPCPSCLFPCGVPINGNGAQGQYVIDMDLGNSTGAAMIFFNPMGVPDKCTWTYDGVSASEYSHVTYGYLQGILGNPPQATGCGITNGAGSGGVTYPGTINTWNGAAFVNTAVPVTMGPYAPQRTVPCTVGGTDLVGGFNAGWGQGFGATMVIPKPNVTPTNLNITVDGPCGGTLFNVIAICPIELNEFVCGENHQTCKDYTTVLYTASVYDFTGVSNVVQLNDWVFEDINGVTQMPTGVYPVDNNGTDTYVTVSCDGIATNIVAC